MKSNYKYKVAKQKRDNIKLGYVPLTQGVNGHNREGGWKSLACAVLEQAVLDYFILVRHGYVRGMQRTNKQFQSKHIKQRNHCQYIYEDDIKVLIDFICHKCKPLIDLTMYSNGFFKFENTSFCNGIMRMEEKLNKYAK